jgi:transposase
VNEVQTIDHCEAGPMHVGYQFWKRLGLDGILERAGLSGYAREITCAMTMNRLIFPSSEHAMPDWIRRTAMGDILRTDFSDINDDTLYRNLDKLYPNRSRIETDLVNAERNLFNLNASVFFYDLTSTYFEGQALGNPKAKRGYSRDKRPDCKQVVIGLVIGREGFPLAHEVFEGNLQDRKSLGGMLDILGKRVGIKAGQTVVIDRGMAFKENLDEIRSRGLHYIVASRQIERNEWLNEFETCADFDDVIRIPSPWNPFQTKTRVRVKKMKKNESETCVLCLSDERANKDRAIRENQEKRFKEDLYKLEKRVADGRLKEPVKIGECVGRIKERYPRVARYYDVEYNKDGGTLKILLDEEKHKTAEELDGSYLLKTDRDDLTADEAWRLYMTLTRAESTFRSMKSPLAERPIFHQIERRVDTHIFLCVLAYHLLVAIEHTFLDKGEHTSWKTVRETLSNHEICTVLLPAENGDILTIRRSSIPNDEHSRLYKLLEIDPEIIKPVKTWIEM